MHDATRQALSRFDHLWAQAQQHLEAGSIEAARMVDGHTDPIDYCLSTISRMVRQPDAPLTVLNSIIAELRTIAPHDFYYDRDSWHITLLGCTPRLPTKAAIPPAQIEHIGALLAQVLPPPAPIRMSLQGIGMMGNQIFIQVLPLDRQWEHLRQTLVDVLLAKGEQPMNHPDKSPVHLNIMRITDLPPAQVPALRDFLAHHRRTDFGTLEVRRIEYLLTDFVVSDRSIFAEYTIPD